MRSALYFVNTKKVMPNITPGAMRSLRLTPITSTLKTGSSASEGTVTAISENSIPFRFLSSSCFRFGFL